jgi:hypothetical protein
MVLERYIAERIHIHHTKNLLLISQDVTYRYPCVWLESQAKKNRENKIYSPAYCTVSYGFFFFSQVKGFVMNVSEQQPGGDPNVPMIFQHSSPSRLIPEPVLKRGGGGGREIIRI